MTRAEIKNKSKGQIKGHIWMFFLITVIVGALAIVGYIPFFGAVALFIFYPWIIVNMYRIYQQFAVKNVAPEPSALFAQFKEMWAKSWVLIIMMELFIFLWSLLLFIPGIIKAMSYAAAPYILAANPKLTGQEALNESKRIMEGHKMDLFVFYLSFIGWILLMIPTFGLLGIWLIPYLSTAEANFFADLGVVPAEVEASEEKVETKKEIAEKFEKIVEEVEEEEAPEAEPPTEE
ncbi:MAG: DUF975 family protein [Oscillospiraceae bacterium]|nr:DUF975 family protein [Oscillospiraceae bacterium]